MSNSFARYIATSKINSNDGFIFNSFTYFTYPTFNTTNSGMAMKFVMRKHHNNMIYDRRYKKLQNVLAEIEGFIHIINLFFYFITIPFDSKRFYEKIINTVYNFEGDATQKLKFLIKSKKIDKVLSPKYLALIQNQKVQ